MSCVYARSSAVQRTSKSDERYAGTSSSFRPVTAAATLHRTSIPIVLLLLPALMADRGHCKRLDCLVHAL